MINILGLSIGLTATGLLCLYSNYELSYDQSHEKASRIYRLTHTRISEGAQQYSSATSFPELGIELKNNFAAIESIARLFNIGNEFTPVFNYDRAGNRISFSEPRVFLADSTFLKIFDLEMLNAANENPLSVKNGLIISQSLARKVFNSLDVVGEEVEWKGQGSYTITGVFADLPKNSHFDFEILASWFNVYGPRSLKRWDGFYNYLLLNEQANRKLLQEEIKGFATAYLSEYNNSRSLSSIVDLQSLSSIHLHSHLQNEHEINGDADVTYGLVIIAVFILILALINYINLSTANAIERAKEVGIRKVIGSQKSQLMWQFLLESFFIMCLSSVSAITAIQMALPYFSDWLNVDLVVLHWHRPQFWLMLITGITITTLLAGLYPAFVMARFTPISLIRRKEKSKVKGFSLRNVLTVFQFAVSLFLIAATLIVVEQTQSIKKKNTGFQKDQILVINLFELVSDLRDSTHGYKLEALKNEVLTNPAVGGATISSDVPGKQATWRGVNRSQEDEHVVSYRVRVSPDFNEVYNIPLTAGRFFKTEDGRVKRQLVVNSAWVEGVGFPSDEEAVGKFIPIGGNDYEIIGVLKDFHQISPRYDVEPMIFSMGIGHQTYMSVALNSADFQGVLTHIQNAWDKAFPSRPFHYFFLDDHFERQFEADIKTGQVISSFSILSILLACMGVFGLSTNLAYQRSKEMSIRKVLGASMLGLIQLFLKNYMILVLFASLIGLPMAYWIAEIWLNTYVFKIEVGIIYFLLPIVFMMVFTLLSTLSQSIKVAGTNPVEVLKKD